MTGIPGITNAQAKPGSMTPGPTGRDNRRSKNDEGSQPPHPFTQREHTMKLDAQTIITAAKDLQWFCHGQAMENGWWADMKLPHRTMLEVELADCVIRIFDMSGGLGLDVAGAIAEKLAFNATREDHQLESRRALGGKKF